MSLVQKLLPLLFFSSISFFSLPSWSLCLQNFNAYGPAYAPAVSSRAEATARELLKEPCDFLFFQEAWTARSYQPLIKKLKPFYPSVSGQHQKHRVGLLQFSKFQILHEEIFRFRMNNQGGLLDGIRKISRVHKAFLVQKIQHSEDQFFVLNAHLHQSSPAIRLTQILDILSWRFLNLNNDWILAGDFNASPGSLEIQLLKIILKVRDVGQESFGGTYPKEFCTYCANNPIGWLGEDQIFDYFFIGEAKDARYQWVPESFKKNLDQLGRDVLSDHAGIRAHLKKDFRAKREPNEQSEILKVLSQAQSVLRLERKKDFWVYSEYLQRLHQEIEQGSGPFFDYLEPK